jgi:tetratricopeptide (TPR) repeat protein
MSSFKTKVLVSIFIGLSVTIDDCKAQATDNAINEFPLQSENTKKIISMLKSVEENKTFIPSNEYFFNERGVDFYKTKLMRAPSNQRTIIRINLADQMLKAGMTEDAIQELKEIFDNTPKTKTQGIESYNNLRLSLALAYFRLGEQQNCILDHNLESCIYPISQKAVYKIKEPTQKAIRLFLDALKDDPSNNTIAWILNIAYMNMGYYPDSVPKKYLISSTALDSDYKMKKFTDKAPDLGLDINEVSGSVIMDDFDNDNDLDLFIYKKKAEYFVNNGDGRFSNRTREAGLSGMCGGRLAIPYQADYNNDGFLDIFISRGGWQRQEGNYPPSSLLKNNGNGTFTDVTIESGLLSFDPTFSACWGDFDNDGWIDLFVSNESPNGILHPCRLHRNLGDGSFEDISIEAGLSISGGCKGVVCGDYNNDGWMDLFLLDPMGSNFLLKNDGKKGDGKISFTNVSQLANIRKPQRGISAFFMDYNNDGWLDIYAPAFPLLTNFSILPSIIGEFMGFPCDSNLFPNLYENNKEGGFIDVAQKKGLNRSSSAMGSNFGDIDNDGFKDLYLGTGALNFNYLIPNRMYRNNGGENFQDVTTTTGTGSLQKGHGIAFGDIDNDGDQDLYATLGGGYTGDNYPNAFYINPGNDNHWLKVKLEGTKSNRSAIGARIKVRVLESGGARDIYTSISSGGSFGASCLLGEIGLGKASRIISLEIFWPTSNTTQVFDKISLNTFYKIKEGEDDAKIIYTPPIRIKGKIAFDNIHHDKK